METAPTPSGPLAVIPSVARDLEVPRCPEDAFKDAILAFKPAKRRMRGRKIRTKRPLIRPPATFSPTHGGGEEFGSLCSRALELLLRRSAAGRGCLQGGYRPRSHSTVRRIPSSIS